jgi:Secretion system C-terminal sorting domain
MDTNYEWYKVKSGSVVKVDSTFAFGKSKIECKNGSNCSKAGDLICDTPPDYGYGLYIDSGCVEPSFKIIDPCGDEIKITNNNYLGSFESCSNYVFSPMQLSIMEKDLLSPKRAALISNNITTIAKVDTFTNLLSPLANATTIFADPVEFDWEDVPNANYTLEISKYSDFSQKTSIFSTKSDAKVNGLLPNTNYYWRVLSFHPLFGTCNSSKAMSKTQKFKTSFVLADNTLSTTHHIKIFPNPILANQDLNILLMSNETTKMTYEVFTVQGQKIYQNDLLLEQGENRVAIPTQSFMKGIYFLKIDQQTFRLIVD